MRRSQVELISLLKGDLGSLPDVEAGLLLPQCCYNSTSILSVEAGNL